MLLSTSVEEAGSVVVFSAGVGEVPCCVPEGANRESTRIAMLAIIMKTMRPIIRYVYFFMDGKHLDVSLQLTSNQNYCHERYCDGGRSEIASANQRHHDHPGHFFLSPFESYPMHVQGHKGRLLVLRSGHTRSPRVQ